MTKKKLCPVDGCDMWIQTKDFCGKHIKMFGKDSKIEFSNDGEIPPNRQCPRCFGGRLIKKGVRHGKQRYECLKCKRSTYVTKQDSI